MELRFVMDKVTRNKKVRFADAQGHGSIYLEPKEYEKQGNPVALKVTVEPAASK